MSGVPYCYGDSVTASKLTDYCNHTLMKENTGMKIKDLVNNAEFDFNAPFRIIHFDSDTEEETVVFNSSVNSVIPNVVITKWISAINTGDDGILEITYVDLAGEEVYCASSR